MNEHDEVVRFIQRFNGAEDVFLHGCCYWFAWILQQRFGAEILYEPVEGHFLAFIPYIATCWPGHSEENVDPSDGRLYDVRGDVSHIYADRGLYTVGWLRRNEPTWYAHIMRDCRDFLDPTYKE